MWCRLEASLWSNAGPSVGTLYPTFFIFPKPMDLHVPYPHFLPARGQKKTKGIEDGCIMPKKTEVMVKPFARLKLGWALPDGGETMPWKKRVVSKGTGVMGARSHPQGSLCAS